MPSLVAALAVGALAGTGFSVFAAGTTGSTTGSIAPARQWMHGGAIVGTVTAVTGSTITVSGPGGGTYTINASSATITKYENSAATTVPLSSIAVGDRVQVRGSTVTATVNASTIRDGIFPRPAPPTAIGKVTAINGSTITIAARSAPGVTTTETVDASSATVTTGRNIASSVSAIKVGDVIVVNGTANGATITATTVHDGFGPPHAGFRHVRDGGGPR